MHTSLKQGQVVTSRRWLHRSHPCWHLGVACTAALSSSYLHNPGTYRPQQQQLVQLHPPMGDQCLLADMWWITMSPLMASASTYQTVSNS
jgi:hypothetical protein